MAAVVVWRRQHRRNLRLNRVFRDRKNPLDMYDDLELYDKFRFCEKTLSTPTRDKVPCWLLCKL